MNKETDFSVPIELRWDTRYREAFGLVRDVPPMSRTTAAIEFEDLQETINAIVNVLEIDLHTR